MFIISVVPFTPKPVLAPLSYYFHKELSSGTLVTIPFGTQKILGLVIESKSAHGEKASIRRAGFSMKKICSVESETAFSKAYIETCNDIAVHHATSRGIVFSALVSTSLVRALRETQRTDTALTTHAEIPEVKILEDGDEARISRYKALTRESFAHALSVCIVCPTIAEAQRLGQHLIKGIEGRCFVLTGRLTPKKTYETLKSILEAQHSVLVITTPALAFFPRHDMGLYVVEHESSLNYKQRERPFLDYRFCIESFAKHQKCDAILGDSFLRIETLYRYYQHTVSEVARPSLRQEGSNVIQIIDMRTEPSAENAPPLPLFSKESRLAIAEALQEKHRLFIFCVRKGFAPFTVCRDCGHILSCDSCDAPMVLYGLKDVLESRSFKCNRCGKSKNAQTVCPVCSSWRLETYGVGIERIAHFLNTEHPTALTFIVSRDATTTPQSAQKIVDAWEKTSSGILLGTEMALPHIRPKSAHVAIVASLDTLTFLPDFHMGERVFHLVTTLASLVSQRLFIQTRTPDYASLVYAKAGDGMGMYRYEEASRKKFGYPPFTLFIKISRHGQKETVLQELNALKEQFSEYSPVVYPAFISKIRNSFFAHLLLTLPRHAWPDIKLVHILRALPPQYTVNVDPDSLL
ncbi:MAG: hypothetical protein NUW02_00040 [Candidatus Campbellbacteria bacterium]|nr:hypothetical protein [Candidatus Campbellbacteria bacterium]